MDVRASDPRDPKTRPNLEGYLLLVPGARRIAKLRQHSLVPTSSRTTKSPPPLPPPPPPPPPPPTIPRRLRRSTVRLCSPFLPRLPIAASYSPAHHGGRRPQDHHRALLRAGSRFPPRHPLVRPLQGLLPAAGCGHLRAGARAQLDSQPLLQPRRLCRKLGQCRAGPRPLLHGLPGGYGNCPARRTRAFPPDPDRRNGYVHLRRTADLRHHR